MENVALCEEGVDRNDLGRVVMHPIPVALCEEGVDRNTMPPKPIYGITCRPLRRGRG